MCVCVFDCVVFICGVLSGLDRSQRGNHWNHQRWCRWCETSFAQPARFDRFDGFILVCESLKTSGFHFSCFYKLKSVDFCWKQVVFRLFRCLLCFGTTVLLTDYSKQSCLVETTANKNKCGKLGVCDWLQTIMWSFTCIFLQGLYRSTWDTVRLRMQKQMLCQTCGSFYWVFYCIFRCSVL